MHDFLDPQLGKAIPYGVYDIGANTGWVSVGCDHDTAAFAVATLRNWWDHDGRTAYPHAVRLLITADGGGSNGTRLRAWKTELAAFAAATGLRITVCHLPPGTSKWNKIEHRLFSHITMNWCGTPLTSHQTVVNLIGAVTTTTGLRVHAELHDRDYPTGIRISDADMNALPIHRHDWHGDWNYTLHPKPDTPDTPDTSQVNSSHALSAAHGTSWGQSTGCCTVGKVRVSTWRVRRRLTMVTGRKWTHERTLTGQAATV